MESAKRHRLARSKSMSAPLSRRNDAAVRGDIRPSGIWPNNSLVGASTRSTSESKPTTNCAKTRSPSKAGTPMDTGAKWRLSRREGQRAWLKTPPLRRRKASAVLGAMGMAPPHCPARNRAPNSQPATASSAMPKAAPAHNRVNHRACADGLAVQEAVCSSNVSPSVLGPAQATMPAARTARESVL